MEPFDDVKIIEKNTEGLLSTTPVVENEEVKAEAEAEHEDAPIAEVHDTAEQKSILKKTAIGNGGIDLTGETTAEEEAEKPKARANFPLVVKLNRSAKPEETSQESKDLDDHPVTPVLEKEETKSQSIEECKNGEAVMSG